MPCAQGWPTHKEVLEIKKGQELVVTTDETAVASSTKLPISYPHFAHMCQPGDSLFVGRYLVNGADQSSLYLEVCSTQNFLPALLHAMQLKKKQRFWNLQRIQMVSACAAC